MSASVEEHASPHAEHEEHFTDGQYIKVALILAAVTAVEVGLYYREIGAANNVALLVLAVAKFVIVALYFMHLKWDGKILRRLFFTGLVLAVFCYITMMLMFRLFA